MTVAAQQSTRFSEGLEAYLTQQRKRVDDHLQQWPREGGNRLVESARYSLLLPSKRLRPLFCLETCRAFLGSDTEAMPAALALEMVHTYSLIHDDLPCMDNDDLRRGQPTNHKVYGDATALLAGSALLTESFRVLSTASVSPSVRLGWIDELVRAAGVDGMLLGQQWDIETKSRTAEELMALHERKTGALLAASVIMGAQAAEVSEAVLHELRAFAVEMGLAFQIRDDILDIIGDESLGKPLRSDERNQKVTYVSLFGLEGAQNQATRYRDSCLSRLREISFIFPNALEELTLFVVDRKR